MPKKIDAAAANELSDSEFDAVMAGDGLSESDDAMAESSDENDASAAREPGSEEYPLTPYFIFLGDHLNKLRAFLDDGDADGYNKFLGELRVRWEKIRDANGPEMLELRKRSDEDKAAWKKINASANQAPAKKAPVKQTPSKSFKARKVQTPSVGSDEEIDKNANGREKKTNVSGRKRKTGG